MKVKDLPSHIKPMLSIDYIKKSISKAMDNYNAKYIQTSSIDPVYHVCFGGMIFSYLVALPEERRHLEHQQHAKEQGGHWSIGLGIITDLISLPIPFIVFRIPHDCVWGEQNLGGPICVLYWIPKGMFVRKGLNSWEFWEIYW